jgi:hypothetical protein
MTGHNPDGRRPKALLYIVSAVLLIMALAIPWAAAEDAVPTDAEATEVEADQAEPTPTPTETEVAEEPEVPDVEEPVEPEVPEETDAPDPEESVETEDSEKAIEPDSDTKKTQPAAPPGNNGTVKVDGIAFDSHPDNEPKPGCSFQIDYTGFDDPTQAFSHTFTIQSGDGNGTVVGGTSGNLVGGAGSYNHDLSSALSAFDPKDDGYYHIKLDVSLPDVPGGSKHKVFKVACGDPPEEEGFIIVEKDVITSGAPAENFAFSGDLGNFSLGDTDTIGPVSVEPGSYDITETISNAQSLAGWSFDGVSCAEVVETARSGGGISIAAASNHTANDVEVEDGETIKCTFSNEYEAPEETAGVIIEKDVLSNGAPNEDFAFTGDFGALSLADGEDTGIMTVAPGDFNVSEVLTEEQEEEGWAFEDASCEEVAVNRTRRGFLPASTHAKDFSVEANQIVRCVFMNTYDPPVPEGKGKVVVEKDVIGTGTPDEEFDFDGTLGGPFDMRDGDSETFLVDPGEYTVEEILSDAEKGDGWARAGATCTEKNSPSSGNGESTVEGGVATADVSEGETVRCVFKNDFTEVLGTDEEKPKPDVLAQITRRRATVLGTVIRRSPLPFTGSNGMAPFFLVGLLMVAGGALAIRATRRQH